MTVLAFFCMDIIQNFAEAILDCVIRQVYRYMRTSGTFSSTKLRVTEDRIHAYLGDFIGQALSKCLKINLQNFVSIKLFSELLVRYISKTVNSVLAFTTKTPILESKIPLSFVSVCVTSIRDLKDTACQMALILMAALNPKKQAEVVTEAQSRPTSSCEPNAEVESPIFCLNSRHDLTK